MIRKKVKEWVERHALLQQGCKVVAACSGGPDSMALVDLLDRLRQDSPFLLFVAHVEHGLRYETSQEDAAFVRQFCDERKLPFFCGHVDVKGEVWRKGGSVEEAARNLRYAYLVEVAAQIGGAVIATGHHRDDQAETLLMNLLRGSGSRGLGAMRPKQGNVVRPLLCLSREEIEAYCQERDLRPRTDATNADVNFTRNRIRHELIPLLRQKYNSSIVDILCRTAGLLADEQAFLREYVAERQPGWATRFENGFRLEADTFSTLSAAVQRELILYLLDILRGGIRGISFDHVEQVRELFLKNKGTKRLNLPNGWQARKSYQELFIEHGIAGSVPVGGFPDQEEELLIVRCPGDTVLPGLGLVLRCSVHSDKNALPATLSVDQVVFDFEALEGPLWVRHRQPGDFFRPMGAPGRKKLKKFFINWKIPVDERDRIHLVCDRAGILWVPGFRRSERGKISPDSRNYVMMELIKKDAIH